MPKPLHDVALALVQRADQWLVAKRRPHAHLGGLWEFPGGKCHENETVSDAAVRELIEECGVSAVAQMALERVTVEYADRIVHLTPVLCRWISGEPQPLGNEVCQWVTTAELARLEMPQINALIIRRAVDAVSDRGIPDSPPSTEGGVGGG
jgi:8-oxo-dGTP diphosphatase